MSKATKRPWYVCGGSSAWAIGIAEEADPNRYIVFEMADSSRHKEGHEPIESPGDEEQSANARLIVQAVNTYDERTKLIESLRSTVLAANAELERRTDVY